MRYYLLPLCFAITLCIAARSHAGANNVENTETSQGKAFDIFTSYTSSEVTGDECEQGRCEIDYGYTNAIQLSASLGINSHKVSECSRKTGFDDIELGYKWRYREETKKQPALSMLYTFKAPTASADDDLGTGHCDHTFTFSVEKYIGKWCLFGCASHSINGGPGTRNNNNYGIAVNYQATERLNIGAEIYGGTASDDTGATEYAYNFVVFDNVAPNKTLWLAAGHSMHGLSDLNVYAGMQFHIGK